MANKKIFTDIYTNNFWRNGESKSGVGSTLEYTENLRKQLPTLFKEFNIKSVLDAPCGDFNWMKHVLEQSNLDSYIGGDIVKELIDDNNREYAKENVKFQELDITQDKLPEADLMICRDCLFHLPVTESIKFIKNFRESNIQYILTTSHVNATVNDGIPEGEFNFINLMIEPYNFPVDCLYAIDDWIEGFPERKMYLWSKDQIPDIEYIP